MAEEPENLTLRLLQEIRGDMHALKQGQESLRTKIDELRTDLTQRIDGNTLILNLLAGGLHEHEHRIRKLEQPTG